MVLFDKGCSTIQELFAWSNNFLDMTAQRPWSPRLLAKVKKDIMKQWLRGLFQFTFFSLVISKEMDSRRLLCSILLVSPCVPIATCIHVQTHWRVSRPGTWLACLTGSKLSRRIGVHLAWWRHSEGTWCLRTSGLQEPALETNLLHVQSALFSWEVAHNLKNMEVIQPTLELYIIFQTSVNFQRIFCWIGSSTCTKSWDFLTAYKKSEMTTLDFSCNI